MNFVPATLADGGATVAASGFQLPVPAGVPRRRGAARDGQKVVARHPAGEHPRGAPARASGGTVPITAKVEFVEPLGHEVDRARPGRRRPAGGQGRSAPLAADGRRDVQLVIEADAAHLFDAATEKRLGELRLSDRRRTGMKSNFVRGTLGALALLLASPRLRPGAEGDRGLARLPRRREGRLRKGGRQVQQGQRRQDQGHHPRRPLRRLRRQDHRGGAARQGAGRLHLRPGPPRRLGGGRQHGRAARLLPRRRRPRGATSRPPWTP